MLRKGGEAREGHPTQKPMEVMRWAIGQLPEPSLSILDPFCGSGTTGMAAVSLGKQFTGIEIDPIYFEMACERISRALQQPDLLVAPPQPVAQQTSMFSDEAA